MNQDMDAGERNKRIGAGIISLPAEFEWPDRFGRGIGAVASQVNETHSTIRKETSNKAKSTRTKSAVSTKSNVSARVLQKKLNYETEKRRQEIEMEKVKLNSQLRLLQLEHEIQEAEILDREENNQSQRAESIGDQGLPRVQEWVNQQDNFQRQEEAAYVEGRRQSIQYYAAERPGTQAQVEHRDFCDDLDNPDSGNRSSIAANDAGLLGLPNIVERPGMPVNVERPGERIIDFVHPGENSGEGNISQEKVVNNPSSEIHLLCQTIGDLLKTVHPGDTFQKNLLARQIIDKDFPIFYGNPEEWPLFQEQYERVSKMCAFSNEEIMVKLRKCLRGEAKSAVSGMMLASENVPLIMETLKMRFGRPDIIIEVLISKVNSFSYMKDINIEKIILFSNEVRNLVETMKSLKSTGHMHNPQLLKDMSNKLPDVLKLKWGEFLFSRHQEGTAADIESFSLWLAEMANAACYVYSQKKYEEPSKNYKKPNPQQRYAVLSTTAKEPKETTCIYCEDGHHRISNCEKLKADDVDTRWEIVKGKQLCFSCLGINHQKLRCKYKRECGTDGCKLKHHKLLHNNNFRRKEDINAEVHNISTQSSSDSEVVMAVQQTNQNILLRMIPVSIHGPTDVVHTLALCDEGSTVSLLDNEIAKKLGLRGKKEPLCIKWTGDISTKLEYSECLDLNISGETGSKIMILKNAHTTDNLSLPLQTIQMKDWQDYPYINNLPIKDFVNERPMLLIGQDNIDLMIPRQIRTDADNRRDSPIATKCRLGWSLHGRNGKERRYKTVESMHLCNKGNEDENLHDLVKNSFSLEAFGVLPVKNKLSREESEALNTMKYTARRVEGRFEIGLIWKNQNTKLPESKTNAHQRLKCMERKCSRNEEFARAYCTKIESYLEKGYLKKLTPEEAKIEPPHTWYLPHFATSNPNKPGKIRLVFDAAAKSQGVSLNDKLMAGPDLLQSLVSVLIKFRQRKYGFTGDVREMFHQVMIRQDDRCAQRLLWRNLNTAIEPEVYEMQVMTFGATCSPACAQFIKNLNAEEKSKTPDILDAITKQFYVDDYLDSTDTEEEAVSKAMEVKRVMSLAGFDVVNWTTNSQEVARIFSADSTNNKDISATNQSAQKVLGIWWNSVDDDICFKLKLDDDMDNKITKRKILRIVMSIFDPLGFLSFHTVGAKILLQEIWRTGVNWDENIPPNLGKVWMEWKEELKTVVRMKIPRCYSHFIPSARSIELHIFCDASEKAYSSVAYLRVEYEGIDTALVMAKTRVAPLKPLSIPRLELQAAVLATRLAETLKQEIEIDIGKIFFWSDSSCVLKWIRSDGGQYKPFVAHRIGEIQEKTQISDWHWIPTEINIADIATRQHMNRKTCVTSTIWLNGPSFLKDPVEKWPEEVKISKLSESRRDNHDLEDDCELKNVFTGTISLESEAILPEITRFSKWLRLIRSTAWVLRFTEILKSRVRGTCCNPISGFMTVEELSKAEKLWIKKSQMESFEEDIRILKSDKILKKNSRIRKLSPEIDDDGLLILSGRTNLAICLDAQTKKPFILCPKHPYTKLLLQFYHEKFGHFGVESILNEIRQKFWIIDGRAAVKLVRKSCQKCKNNDSVPKPPIMGQLPLVRLTPCIRPFVNVGMDCFGPYSVAVGRRREKRWGVLFTCLAVRAVHLELISTMSTDSAIMAIRRFIARRGNPQTIFCDNGTNLRGAAEELRRALKELDQRQLIDFSANKKIDFHFISPGAPHMGGAWERLIGSIKKSLGVVVHQQSLREETLATLFAEAENIVNSRPLTHVSVDPRDPEALTPNHFLVGYAHTEGSPGEFNPGNCLRKEWRKSQMLANGFWKRWVKEYLPTLNKRKKWTDNQSSIKNDDIVLIVDENSPRNHWQIGKIVAVYPGPDGRVRVADVQTRRNTYKRPVTKLCKLDVRVEE